MAETFSQAKFNTQVSAEKYVIPFLQHRWPHYQISTVEGLGESLAMMLDMDTGADILVKDGALSWLVASRIQLDKGHRTFSIRYLRDNGVRTEYSKRLEAMQNNAIRPRWNVHTYFKGDYASIAIIESDPLIIYLHEQEKRGELKLKHTGYGQFGGATFCYATWDELKAYTRVVEWSGNINDLGAKYA